jgi:hypothetical protein
VILEWQTSFARMFAVAGMLLGSSFLTIWTLGAAGPGVAALVPPLSFIIGTVLLSRLFEFWFEIRMFDANRAELYRHLN